MSIKSNTNFYKEILDQQRRRREGIPYREPLKNFMELADMVNVTPQQLKVYFKVYKPAPKMELQHRNIRRRASWYNVKEFKAWWETIPKENK
jgi:hypothetical protein